MSTASTTPPHPDPCRPWGARLSHEGDDMVVVWLSGEHDLASAGDLDAVFLEAVGPPDRDVVVDMFDVEFLGAATLGPLLRCRARLATRGRGLTVRSPPRCARLVLNACDLGHLVEPYRSSASLLRSAAHSALETWVEVPVADPPAVAVASRHSGPQLAPSVGAEPDRR